MTPHRIIDTSRFAFLAVMFTATACASGARTHAPTGSVPITVTPASESAQAVRNAALEDLRAHMAAGDATALSFAGIQLARGADAREMTGETAADEHVERAVIVNRSDDAATILVCSTCGNASLVSGRWDGTHWTPVTRVALEHDFHPGRCGQTNVRAEGIRLTSDQPSEIAVVIVSEDATGESVRGPFLSVYKLEPDAHLATLLSAAPFGSMDDATGATTQGEFLVVPDVPAPRDLHVAIRPGRPGPGGAPAAQIVRRRYAFRAGHLELVEERTEEAD